MKINSLQQKLFIEGVAALNSGKPAEALSIFKNVLEIDKSDPVLHLHAGAALHELKRFEEAIEAYERAIILAPKLGEAFNNKGNSLMAIGRFVEAADAYLDAAVLLPLSPIPLAARATALQALGMIGEAERSCRHALSIDATFAEAHWNLALLLLLKGDFREGWQEYEWRWRRPTFTSPLRHQKYPLWDGSPLYGKRILLHAEQGFGDAIQFVRYAPLIAKVADLTILECHPQLVTLFNEIEGVDLTIPFDASSLACDYQLPFLSLPRIFGTDSGNIPAQVPYLSSPKSRLDKWHYLIGPFRKKINIGLVWSGKQYPDPLRSCRQSDLAPLAHLADTALFSLQLQPPAEPEALMNLIDLTSHIKDFSDTAALIEQLDLVISIDTAVAHLAGALGKPVWILLPFAPDWRWQLDREDSPWYPSMRLFRQQQAGAWKPVISKVVGELKKRKF